MTTCEEHKMGTARLGIHQVSALTKALRRNDYRGDEIDHLCMGNNLSRMAELERLFLGWTDKDISRLDYLGYLLQGFRDVLYGKAVITEPVIDLNAEPEIPKGWTLYKHYKEGKVLWDDVLFRPVEEGSQEGGMIFLDRNANLLDFALKHTHLLPVYLCAKAVAFCRTVYLDKDGKKTFRVLRYDFGSGMGDSQFFESSMSPRAEQLERINGPD